MVQGILEGRKTQTRRIVKQKVITNALMRGMVEGSPGFDTSLCPYGHPGDRLWVRETWARTVNVHGLSPWPERPHLRTDDIEYIDTPWEAIIYRADGEWSWCDGDGFSSERSHWKPSIHMPRSASRILLEITSVRVELLQDITQADAVAEGVQSNYPCGGCGARWKPCIGCRHSFSNAAVDQYRILWESVNGSGSWDINPWVWVIEFKRIE